MKPRPASPAASPDAATDASLENVEEARLQLPGARATCHRRAVRIAGLAASVRGITAAARARGGPSATAPARGSRAITGLLRFAEGARTAAADDFGHLVHRTPAAVLSPASDQDVATVIRDGRGSSPRRHWSKH